MSRWDPNSEQERKAHPKSKTIDMIRDVFRGNCQCGKWLVILPTFTIDNPLECHGPCHSDIKCGRKHYVAGDEVKTIEPPHPQPWCDECRREKCECDYRRDNR